MKLYSHPGSCSSASHICLLEAGLDFDIEKIDLHSERKLSDGRHLSDVNPKGYVPVLELDNGEILTENIAILQYIGDQNPASGIVPSADSMARLRLQEWLGFINSEIHKTCGALFTPNLPDSVKSAFLDRLNGRLEYIDNHLANHDYLLGGQFSAADAYLFVILNWEPMIGFDLSGYQNIKAFQSRMSERDSVKQYFASMAH